MPVLYFVLKTLYAPLGVGVACFVKIKAKINLRIGCRNLPQKVSPSNLISEQCPSMRVDEMSNLIECPFLQRIF